MQVISQNVEKAMNYADDARVYCRAEALNHDDLLP